MADILGSAVSGLLSFQRALSTTSHNIANVNTEGYSRQRVELDTRPPSFLGGNYVGNGVELTGVRRAYDQFITLAVRETNSSYYRQEKFTELASQVDNILADPQGGVSPILQEFFAAVQDVSDDPTSGPARLQLLSTAESLVNRFDSVNTRLDQLTANTEADIQTAIDEINQLAVSIADINLTLAEANAAGDLNQQSADLLDKRDALLNELSQKVSIQVLNEPENNITVLIGNGQTMVAGTESFSLDLDPDPADPTRSIIVYQGFSTINDMTDQIKGGELGGLLDYRSTVLEPAINSLGRVAIGLADSFNDQHRAGMDLNSDLGGDFFSFTQPTTIPNSANTGTSVINTTITDINQLTIDDYTLSYDGANWQLVSSSGSASTAANVTPDVPNIGDTTLTFEGLTVVVDAASLPVNGDTFTIRPTEQGAGSINLALSDPNKIAAASLIRTDAPLTNLGDVVISPGVVNDGYAFANALPTAGDLSSYVPVTMNFISASQFTATENVTIDGGASFIAAGTPINYVNGMTIEVVDASNTSMYQFSLSGTDPRLNDTYTVAANSGGVGDNRNALGLANLQTTNLFDNSSNTYQDAYGIMVGRIGTLTLSAQLERDVQGALLAQAEDRQLQIAGVNLDEEAADMIKYQQAYEAAARVISTAQVLFDTLINSTR